MAELGSRAQATAAASAERGPLRAVVLQPAAELGGAERSLVTALAGASASELEATVLLPRAGPLAEALAAIGVRTLVVEQPRALLVQSRRPSPAAMVRAGLLPFALPGYLRQLGVAVGDAAPDVLWSNGVKTHLLSAALVRSRSVPVVWHVRDFLGGPFFGRLADRVPTRIIANSHAVAAQLAHAMRRPEKIAVAHNAVDLERFAPDGPRAGESLVRPATYRVGLPAVLARWKGHSLLLAAARRVLSELPDASFFLIGGAVYDTVRERGYEAELRRETERLGLAEAVVTTGFQREMPPWYRAMDVVVHTSTRPEPFGRTVLEAMACGRAVVAADAGGVREIVRHGETGILYPMGDPAALAEAILAVLRDPALRARLGRAARRAAERFGAREHGARIVAILREAATASAARLDGAEGPRKAAALTPTPGVS